MQGRATKVTLECTKCGIVTHLQSVTCADYAHTVYATESYIVDAPVVAAPKVRASRPRRPVVYDGDHCPHGQLLGEEGITCDVCDNRRA